MNCIKNKKLFLGIEYEGSHNWKIIDIGVHMANISSEFKVKLCCEYCGCIELESHVSFNHLFHQGYSAEYLNERKWHEI